MERFGIHSSVACIGALIWGSVASGASIFIDDASFEEETGQLPTPLLSPPMSGQIGGWLVVRDALVVTGPTVPGIGVSASAAATLGSNLALISFGVAVVGSGEFSQTLESSLTARTTYQLKVDVGTAGLAELLPKFGFRILAGTTVMASSQDGSLLTILDLDGDFSEYTLEFTTCNEVTKGSLTIELFAESLVGAVSAVAFDNIRLEAATSECFADLDCNNVVNGMDLAILLGQWTGASSYSPCPPLKPEDLDQDCDVNGIDLAMLLAAWGPCPR